MFLIGLIGISTYNLSQKQAVETTPIAANEPAGSSIHFVKTRISLPDFTLPDLYDGNKTFSKKTLLGKYSIINFFASWCTTCRAEHNILLRLQSEKIIDIYGVAWRDIDENTKRYLEKSGNPFKSTAKDGHGLFTDLIGLESIPETLIIDPKGNIVMRYRGNLQDFSINEIKEFLRKNNAL